MAVPMLSIVIPAYNESARLPATLAGIADFLPHYLPQSEVLVVDDGSSDHTVQVVKALQKRFPLPLRVHSLSSNQGKGAAVRAGVLQSTGEYVLLMDADNATPITELPRLWKRREDAAVILGSRYLPGSEIRRAQPLLRRIISRVGNGLIRVVAGLPLTDTQNGFKLLKGAVARESFRLATIDRWGFDVEVLVIAKRRGYGILEVPVSWYDAAGSKLRAGRDAWRTLRELVRIRSNAAQGVYEEKA